MKGSEEALTTSRNERNGRDMLGDGRAALTTSRTFSPVASHSPATLHMHSGGPVWQQIFEKSSKGKRAIHIDKTGYDN